MPVNSAPASAAAAEGAAVAREVRYEPCIDGWRAIAAGMVLVAHFFPHGGAPNTWMHLGQTGVVIFFIISGYLISLILFSAKKHVAEKKLTLGAALRRFYIRRMLRIAPIYYASIFAMYFIGLKPIREHVWWFVTYTSNIGHVIVGLDFKNAGHFWSLAVEEQFYFAWPLMVLMVAFAALRGTIRWLFAGSLMLILAMGFCGGSVWLMTMLPVGGASLALAYGGMLAHGKFYENGVHPVMLRVSLWVGTPLFLFSQVLWFRGGGQPEIDRFEYKMIYVWAVVLFFGAIFVLSLGRGSMLNRLLSNPVLRYLGRISYGVYVYHLLFDPYFYSIWARCGLHMTLSHFSEGLLKSATTIVIAALSWHLFEKPILSLKDRLAPGV
jgi:peptidoglycan/LPS O-acetylase OafA/YrhL